ncbi:DUF6945 domain-containing protein [Klebsiella michiganensis]|nr:hypothetical protein [Klebsiella michiganensis]HBQ1805887.1 hypothetical protein [Klebsiella aerogenes]HCT7446960.1 hypothetical protein [Klebsiella variicola]
MTETAKTKVIKEPSLIVPKRLTAHKIIVKATGEVIRVTNDHRIIYAYLEDQFRGLTNPKNIAAGRSTGHFYNSDENLAIKNDVSKSTFKKVKKDLKALGLIDWKTPKAKKSGHACEYFVKQLIDTAHNLEFIYQELPNGLPSYDHERVSGLKAKRTKKAAAPANEENKGDDESDQGDAEQRDGVPDIHSDQHDDVSANDAVNGAEHSRQCETPPVLAVNAPSQERQNQPQKATLEELQHWQHGGDPKGFDDYGAKWGKTTPGAIMDLINSHVKTIQSDGYKGSRSAANDTPSGADDYYKQQQAQRIAAAKQGANTPQQQEYEPPLDFDETIPF